MKRSTYGLFTLLIAFLVISACTKSGGLSGQTGKLTASSYKVKIVQPDSLVLNGAKTTDTVHWSVTPSGYDSIIIKNNAALIFFKKAGTYQVQALDNKFLPATASITVTDSVYTPPVTFTNTPLTGDQITLVPYYHSGADSSYLSFVAQTKNFYCGISKLLVADSLVSGKYGINFLTVVQPSPCTIGQLPISATLNFITNQPALLAPGTFPLSVTLNGKVYTGSINITATTITFNWAYTSGVLISPATITR